MDVQIDVKADAISKAYWKNNRRFAAICNAALFHGRNVINERNISQWDSEETTILETQDFIVGRERRRDLMREVAVLGVSILVGLENQQYKDKTMPLRDMEYALMNYVNQKINKSHTYKAVFMIVLYYGEENWKDDHALSNLVELPNELIEFFNDWKPIVIDVKEFDYTMISDQEVRDCFCAIQRVHKWKGRNDIFDGLILNKETALFVSVVTGCKELEEVVRKYKEKEEINMCTSFDMVLNRIRAEEQSKHEEAMEKAESNFARVLEKERHKVRVQELSKYAEKLEKERSRVRDEEQSYFAEKLEKERNKVRDEEQSYFAKKLEKERSKVRDEEQSYFAEKLEKERNKVRAEEQSYFAKKLEKERNKVRDEEQSNFAEKLEKEKEKLRIESKVNMLTNLVGRKLGLISQDMMTMLNQANDDQLDKLFMEIFDIRNENDIMKILS